MEHRATLRELTRQAHGTNLDLGAALFTELATVAADDIDVARFFALCGCPHRANYADRAAMPTRWSGGRVEHRRERAFWSRERRGCRHSWGGAIICAKSNDCLSPFTLRASTADSCSGARSPGERGSRPRASRDAHLSSL